MSHARVLRGAASAALLLAVSLTQFGAVAPAGARPAAHVAKDDKDKGKDDKGKGNDPAPAPATDPAPAPVAPPAKPKGKPDDKPAPASTTTTPTPTTTAGAKTPPAAAHQPGGSAQPSVAFDTPALAPTLAQSVGVATATGTVRVRTADGRDVRALDAVAAIPAGAHVDARDGAVELSAALDATGTTQTATFSGGIFEVRQAPDAGGVTQLVLAGGDFSRCRATAGAARATIAKRRRKPIRSLWGKDDHGRFETRGKGAVGTVRGTRWLTEDYCDGTLTRVVEGTVAVRDLAKHRTVVVRAGHSYFARTR